MKSTMKPQLNSPTRVRKTPKDKERDKRVKPQSNNENLQQPQQCCSTDSNCQSNEMRRYSVLAPEMLNFYAEQSVYELLTDDARFAIMEDINYKLRLMIHEAQIKAKLLNRNFISCEDLDETFDTLQVERVYGVSEAPTFLPLPEQNILYLDDDKVNLIELSEENFTHVQEGDVSLTVRNLSSNDVSAVLRNYFVNICEAVVSDETNLRTIALKNIRENHKIGPIIELLYQFGYLLLSKDITYDSLTVRALALIEALETNRISGLNVSEKQLKLLIRLLLQRLLRPENNIEILQPLCNVINLICYRAPLRILVLTKLLVKFYENMDLNALPVITASNTLGMDALVSIILPNLSHLLNLVDDEGEEDAFVIFELLKTYNTLCVHELFTEELNEEFDETFADGLVPFWREKQRQVDTSNRELNWLRVKSNLLRTRRSIPQEKTAKSVVDLKEVFSLDEIEGGQIRNQGCQYDSARRFPTEIIIGKMNLSTLSEYKRCYVKAHPKCFTHTLFYYNL